MRLFLILFILLVNSCVFSQSGGLNNALKMKLIEPDVKEEIHTILVEGNVTRLSALSKISDLKVNYSRGTIASITCRLKDVANLIDLGIVSYAEFIAPHLSPLNDTMLIKNRITSVKMGASPLSQPYNGNGVVLGIIDTGIDFSHPDFKDSLGKTRIRFLWDQVPVSGSTVPSPFNYGVEWTHTQIDASLCTHSDLPNFGHGTHVAGIAAGNGYGNHTHYGCASESDLVVVALDFNKTGPITADAVQYILNKATALGKPCVINASVGDYYGSHDATDLEAKMIENMVANVPGLVMVAAVGNGGSIKYHVKTQVAAGDSGFTWIKKNSTTLNYWLYADTSQAKTFSVSIGANRSNYSDLGKINFKAYNYGLTTVQTDTLKYNGNRIGIIKNSSSINPSGVYELYTEIQADTTGLFWRIETKGTGTHHAWNFDHVSSGLPTSIQYPAIAKYVSPDTLYTMVSSFQCSDEIITVSNYVNLTKYYDVNGTLQNLGLTPGKIAPTSSGGPTRDGRQKPDIAASGHGIFSAIPLAMQASQITNSPHTVAQGSLHIRGGGSSAASPIVAGLAALYLQRHPTATNQQIKNAITTCAYSDAFTGSSLPNYQWGYGKLDGMAAMVCLDNMVDLGQAISLSGVSCFPNPFTRSVLINTEKKIMGKITFYGADGRLLFEDVFNGTEYKLMADRLKGASRGLVIARISGADNHHVFKLIME